MIRRSNNVKLGIISLLITLTIAIIGVLLAGDTMQIWYPTLEMPWLNIPLWVFIPIQILYYLICGIIIYRILKHVTPSRQQNISLALLLTMMICAELWNYLFLGLRSTFAGMVGMILFTIITIMVYIHLRRAERYSSRIMIPYLVWLAVDNIWIFELWRVNR